MTNKQHFKQLVSLYREVKFEPSSRRCSLTVADADQLVMLQTLLADCREYGLTLVQPDSRDEVHVGTIVQLDADDPRIGLGLLAETFDNVLDFPSGRTKEPPFFLIDSSWATDDCNPPDIVCRYRQILLQINLLVESAAYFDKENQEMIFVDDGKFVLPILYDTKDLQAVSLQAVNDLLSRLSQDTHRMQKLVILSRTIRSICAVVPEKTRFKCFLMHQQDVLKQFDEGYKLFVADFSYEKIVDQMEDAKLEELAKIHKTFSDIQNQILSIPVATVIVATQIKATSKVDATFWVNTAILIGAIIFVVLTCLLIRNQRDTLKAIDQEIERKRIKIEKEYVAIKDITEETMGSLKKRLNAQRWTFRAVEIIVTIGMIMAISMYIMLTGPVCMWLLHI